MDRSRRVEEDFSANESNGSRGTLGNTGVAVSRSYGPWKYEVYLMRLIPRAQSQIHISSKLGNKSSYDIGAYTMSSASTTIPKGSWILVTGATGYLGSQVARLFLENGYNVRGTVRDLEKASWLVNDVLKSYADRGDFELVVVPDLAADRAFDDAVKGMSAIAHVATIVSFEADPNKVIPQTIAGTLSIMGAALKEPSVVQFVYTSSFLAATMPIPGNTSVVTRDSWNDIVVQLAWAPPPYEPSRGAPVYAASKVSAEQALWKFVKEKKPHFAVNVVSPSTILGEPLGRVHTQTGVAWVKQLYDGDISKVLQLPAIISISVKDVAWLHVAAVLDPTVRDARLQAWGQFCNWNDVLSIMRKLYPKRNFVSDIPNLSELSISTDLSEPVALLKKWAGQDGWTSLEETIAENLRPIVEWEEQDQASQ